MRDPLRWGLVMLALAVLGWLAPMLAAVIGHDAAVMVGWWTLGCVVLLGMVGALRRQRKHQ